MPKRTCDGRCCAVFPLVVGARERLAAGANGKDGPFILDMLVPLTRRQARQRARRFGFVLPWRRTTGQHDLFTCRHWDEQSRLCGVYASRPRMCRDYPYERACEHPDCPYRAPLRTQSRWRAFRRRQKRQPMA